MRLARNELKIAIAAMCLLVLFAAVYLVIQLTGDNGTIVADSGDQPDPTQVDADDSDPADNGDDDTVPIVEDDTVDPFETEPVVRASDAGAAWDDLFPDDGDGPTLMETPGADGSDPQMLGDSNAPLLDDIDPERARLSAGGTDLPAEPADDTIEDTGMPDFTGPRTYTVRTGDSFYTIARDQLGDANLYLAIERANPLIDPRKLRPGMEIKLPDASDLTRGSGNRVTAPGADLTIDGHVIKAGETLSDIAYQHYGKAHLWRDIYAANRDKLESPNRLRVGVVLIIPELAE